MRLYAYRKVASVEKTPEFIQARIRSKIASTRIRKAYQDKIDAAIAMAWATPVALPEVRESVLHADAGERLAAVEPWLLTLRIGVDDLVAGFAVEILVEASDPSLWQLDEMFATPGVRTARSIVRKRIYSLIVESHPWLQQECLRRTREETEDPNHQRMARDFGIVQDCVF